MTDRNDNKNTSHPTIGTTGTSRTDLIENQYDRYLSEDDDSDDDEGRSPMQRKTDRETELLMKWLTRKDWIASMELTKKIKADSSTLNQDEMDMKYHTSQIFHYMIHLLQMYPETFLHYMEQSNDINQNWDAVILLIEQLSSSEYFHTNADIARADHHALEKYLSSTILVQAQGWTFLHWLCSHGGTPIAVIKTLIRQFSATNTTRSITEMILQPTTYIGDNCLHLLCRNACQFSATKLHLLLSPLSDQVAQNALLQRNYMGGTVLHAATIGAAVFDVIRTMVSIQPKVLLACSKDGVHPVKALYYSYSDTIPGYMAISQLLSDHHHRRHHHHDCNNSSDPSLHEVNEFSNYDDLLKRADATLQRFWEKVEYLAIQRFLISDACPIHLLKCSKEKEEEVSENCNERRKFLLHGLLQCNVPIKMIELCLCIHPISCTAIDRHGNAPLHVMLQSRPYHHGMIKNEYESLHMCIRIYPRAAGMVNHQQFLPLQLAIFHKIPVSSGIYDLLLNAAPNSIHYRCTASPRKSTSAAVAAVAVDEETDALDGIIGLYPYQLAAIQNSTSLQSINTVYYLLLKQPSLLGTEQV